ncbi:MAG: GAF domain-containing protein [Candidatus Obscuribacterales bacterium]
MSAQSEKSSAKSLECKSLLKLFNRVIKLLQAGCDQTATYTSIVELVGVELRLDRCALLLLEDVERTSDSPELSVAAEYCVDGLIPIIDKHYALKANSELFRLFQEAKPVPLQDVAPRSSGANHELNALGEDTCSKALIVFPIVDGEKILGCLSMHYCIEAQTFSDDVLEFGEAASLELSRFLVRERAQFQKEAEGRIFKQTSFPALVLDNSGRVRKFNDAFQSMLKSSRKDFVNQSILDVIPDGQRVLDAVRGLSEVRPFVTLGEVLVGRSEVASSHFDVCISSLCRQNDVADALLMFVPPGSKQVTMSAEAENSKRASEQLANSLSRQMSWERWVRQIICKLHATLDRDTILQTVVDGFGRALGASRCLIVRTDGPASPLVTHEYAEPDLSPLGLGRTGQFPTVVVSYFRNKVAFIPDVAALERSHELSADEYEYFSDNGIKSMAGAPIVSHGINYGVIISLESAPSRHWTAHELDMLEVAASQTAVALSHSQQYLQLKDQLFNMNLLGNLTQQLTNTLELVSRSKIEAAEERRPTESAPPLSLRELEVLKLIASGLANREIAQRLFLTESTVELHASRIRKKLKLKSRTALVKFACDNGLA